MESIWRKQTKKINGEADIDKIQSDNVNWDVIVVGAGMAGFLIAYYLQEKGKRYLFLRRQRLVPVKQRGLQQRLPVNMI